MPAVNTYHTLNEYRMSTESTYEGGSQSKLAAGAIVIAIFLGVGGYFYYSAHRAENTPSNVNYQAPAATDSAAPADTSNDAIPDASNAAATSPEISPTNAALTPAQDTAVNRTTTERNVASAQPVQRAKQSTKPLSAATSKPAATSDTATAVPEATEITGPATISPQPAAVDSATEAPTNVAPDSATEGSSGG